MCVRTTFCRFTSRRAISLPIGGSRSASVSRASRSLPCYTDRRCCSRSPPKDHLTAAARAAARSRRSYVAWVSTQLVCAYLLDDGLHRMPTVCGKTEPLTSRNAMIDLNTATANDLDGVPQLKGYGLRLRVYS